MTKEIPSREKWNFKRAFLSGLVFFSGIVFSLQAAINFPNFSTITGLNLIGSAQQAGTVLRLMDTVTYMGNSAVWYLEKELVANGFETEFQFMFTGRDILQTYIADGVAFVIHNDNVDGSNVIGGTGEKMGYGGICNGLAVEFDVWKNYGQDDPDSNHIAVKTSTLLTPDLSPAHDDTARLASQSKVPQFSRDGKSHKAKIVYSGNTLSIFLDDVSVLMVNGIGMDSILANDASGKPANGKAWVGLTSADGSACVNCDILSWTFTPGATPIREYSIKNVTTKPNVLTDASFSKHAITIFYYLPIGQSVTLKLMDPQGRNISFLNTGYQTTGFHRAMLCTNHLSTGIYYSQIKTDKNSITKSLFIK